MLEELKIVIIVIYLIRKKIQIQTQYHVQLEKLR